MADHDHPADTAISAASVSVATCSHGSVFIRLHDASGEVFAYGCMDIATAVAASTELTDACESVIDAIAAGQVEPPPEVH